MSSKSALYVFNGAVWPSGPWLAVYALGYEDQVEVKQINLIEGANFAPEFLKLSPTATIPILILPDRTIQGTNDVVSYLVSNAPNPAGKSSGTDFLQRLHEDLNDPNTALLATRNDAELDAKRAGVPGTFLKNRQEALLKYAPTAPEFASFYEAKIKANGYLNDVYTPGASEELKNGWFTHSQKVWDSIRAFILNDIPAVLPDQGENGAYIGGATPGEEDFQLAAWLARIALLTGATPAPDGAATLKAELGGAEVPEKIIKYWQLWSGTEAWKKVYAHGLH
ncbi:hypothetical protein FRB99_005940 [Tulasnella sp. 403]|nr:hypothetical protein FRB99_005940 [Tulasnella sp. 403]